MVTCLIDGGFSINGNHRATINLSPSLGGTQRLTVQYHIYICSSIKPNRPFANVIQHLKTQSTQTLIPMSLSAESLNLCCKHTATKHAMNNGDLLVVWKRAHKATVATVPKNGTTVSLNSVLRHPSITIYDINRQLTLVAILLSIWKTMRRTLT